MPPSLNKLKGILSTALEHTAPLWPAIATVYDWVHRAAEILNNEAQQSAHAVQRSYRGLLGAITRWQTRAGDLAAGVAHFLNVTRSHWPGLFHCYERADLPRTNNDLEQCFGSWRYHQRRSTGRKTAPASSVLRGAVQLVVSTATHLHAVTAHDLAQVSHQQWRLMRSQLEPPRQKRLQQRRFRRDPDVYLAQLEATFLQLTLPP
ncbi:MAG: hypothetical protein ACTS2F_29100 [Thainema sp.]